MSASDAGIAVAWGAVVALVFYGLASIASTDLDPAAIAVFMGAAQAAAMGYYRWRRRR